MRTCPRCGEKLNASNPVAPSTSAASTAAPAPSQASNQIATPSLQPVSTLSYSLTDAGFFPRAAALALDVLIFSGPAFLVMSVIPIFGTMVACWLYSALFESSTWQATPGKLLMKLRVTDVNGVRLTFGRASARFFGHFVSMLPLGAGFLMVFFTQNKQALHDLLASTRVLRK